MWQKTFDTVLCADSVEFCASSDGRNLAVGTYQLDKDTGVKTGCVYLFDECLDSPVGSVQCDAIFDMKWASPDRLVMATNQKHLGFLNVKNMTIDYPNGNPEGSNEALLALDLSERFIVSSGSQGNVHICDANSGIMMEKFLAHDLEVWAVALGNDGRDLFTGADDALFKQWDLRIDERQPVRVSKVHGAGACSIAISPFNESMMATGSYDKVLRMWDLRMPFRPVSEPFRAQSGIWRLKWCPDESDLLLMACMHDGFYVLNASSATVLDHKTTASLAYGCAWGRSGRVYGCTFYDHEAKQWNINK